MNHNEKTDIVFDTTNEYLEELTERLSEFINSSDFEEELKNRLLEKGVNVVFNNQSETKVIGTFSIPKYLLSFDETIDNIKDNITIL